MTTTKDPGANAPATESPNGQEPDQVLDLMELSPVRRLVKLPTKRKPEGEQFELRLVDDFGIEMQQKLMTWSRKYQELLSKDGELDADGESLSAEERARLRFLLDGLFNTVLDAPKAVRDKMPDPVRNRVVTAFSWAPVLARQEQQTALITKLIDKGHLTQEQVDEAMDELRNQILSQSTSAN